MSGQKNSVISATVLAEKLTDQPDLPNLLIRLSPSLYRLRKNKIDSLEHACSCICLARHLWRLEPAEGLPV